MLNYLKYKSPDYILFPGDLLDYLDMIFEPSERDRLLFWLQELGRISKTFISNIYDFYGVY